MPAQQPLVALFKREWLPGSETFIRQQQDSLTQFRTTAVGARRVDSPLARDTDILIYENARLASLRYKVFSALGRSPRMRQLLQALKPAVLHAHFASEGMTIRPLARRLGVPLVVTLHGHDITAAPRTAGLRGLRYRMRLRRLFSDASRIVAVSQFIKQQAIEFGCPPEKITVCYIGTDTTRGAIPSDSEADSTPKWDLLFVGRLVPKKGVADLLQATHLAQKQLGTRVKIGIVGSGPEQENLTLLASQLGLDVSFLGALPPEQVRGTMHDARVFCAPSQTAPDGDAEGFGMVFLEAALAGLPVLAYRHGGVPEAVVDNETGLLTAEMDYNALGEGITKLLSDPALAERLGTAGKRRVQSQFDVRRCTESLEQVYFEAFRD